jgi:DNA-binding XRE family transcriptional regulator
LDIDLSHIDYSILIISFTILVIKDVCQKGKFGIEITRMAIYNIDRCYRFGKMEVIWLEIKSKKVNLDKIKALRKREGYSLEDMAKMLGYESPNGYYYLEIGRGRFPAETLAKVADIFNVPIEDLFFENDVAKSAKSETA